MGSTTFEMILERLRRIHLAPVRSSDLHAASSSISLVSSSLFKFETFDENLEET